jgi:glycerophosphoryl diester phosphodiesterase
MVHHDDALGRLTEGSAQLDAMSAADLSRVSFKATSDRMISLGELCDLVSGRVTLAIELKSRYDGDLRLVRRAAAVISSYRGPAALMSFDTAQIAALRHIAPELPRGIDAGNGSAHRDLASMLPHARRALSYCSHAATARPQFLAYSVRQLPATIPLAARTLLGLPLLTWTVRTSEDRARAARWADQMIFEGFRP